MDAMTFYIIVRLANGDPHMAMKTPLRGEACETVRESDRARRVFSEQMQAKPKLITWFCADATAFYPKAAVSPPGPEGPADPPAPVAQTKSPRQASP
jgi:hypothetical protein